MSKGAKDQNAIRFGIFTLADNAPEQPTAGKNSEADSTKAAKIGQQIVWRSGLVWSVRKLQESCQELSETLSAPLSRQGGFKNWTVMPPQIWISAVWSN